eukprot:CAMPEP_0197246706 /NCGR_PEP_ID=MMETSP1429-20130617/20997_1 /TAXON_ID=49237 /ORGANISM="Chaetoceros  sp., Strain UNC1202" /LENGTH=133 /DNA_ID=CAMNT_0042707435 /DNA_START=123 /DNA_END=524 /DNA_ORIENTATION=-
METNVRLDEIPDGFTTADPTSGPGGGQGESANAKAAAQEEQKRSVLEQALTPEALARLGTLKLVKPGKAQAVESMIANMAMAGKIQARISEGKLIEMLEGIGAKQSKQANISIQRKRYAFDSDDDDDDDDDLL